MAKLTDVNTTDLRSAIELGCGTMSRVFNLDADDAPYFGSLVWPHAAFQFNAAYSDAHVPGRHLNALLNAEATLGIKLDEAAVAKHRAAALRAYAGPLPLPLNRHDPKGPVVNFLYHNLREGFHALYALAAYRDDAEARQRAEASIDAISRLWRPDRRWDTDALRAAGPINIHESTFIVGEARAIGPLVKYYRATGYTPALQLAIELKNVALADYFTPDGGYDPRTWGGHTHSATCTMSSLAQLADVLGDHDLLERVRTFYDRGLWQMRDALGWVIESAGNPKANPDMGEMNNTGDIVETALILGRAGHTRYYADAERIVRSHILPSQLRDVSFITEPANPQGIDALRDVAARHVGAFGFPAPYGHHPIDLPQISFNLDIVGGTVGSLCEVVREATRHDAAGHWVNLLFDHETRAIKVESPYTHDKLRVTLKQPGALFVRIPPWADRAAMLNSVRHLGAIVHRDSVFIASPPVGTPIVFDLALTEQTLMLHHRTRQIRVRLRGDEVVAMDNFGADLTFFEPY